MKRNEKILVYAVTGFLAVVLAIAVLFGENDLPRKPSSKLGDLMAAAEKRAADEGEQTGGEAANGANGGVGVPGTGTDTERADTERAGDLRSADAAGVGEAVQGAANLSNQFSLDASARRAELSAEDRLTAVLGSASTIVDGQWRRVVVKRGDTLGRIALDWCGSTAMLDEIKRLNEGVTDRTLQPGDRLLLPLVPAEELLEARDARVAGGNAPGGGSPVRAGTAAGPVDADYTVVQGDSAWRIAERFVSRNEAPRFIEELKRLNPHVPDIDRLKVGDKLRLPKLGG